MMRWIALLVLPFLLLPWPANAKAPGGQPRTSFRVKYVSSGALYLDGGKNDGLAVGMTLTVQRAPEGAALLNGQVLGVVTVIAVASSSAACQFSSQLEEIYVGDIAVLSPQDAASIHTKAAEHSARQYAQVIRFTDEEALEQDQRAEVPRPPLPEINRLRASVSLEYSGIVDRGDAGGRSSQEGVSVRANMTRLGGTYWNVSGYWRGRRTSRRAASQTETLSDLLSRTYHISLSYHNPQSRNVAGFGRLLLPFASSLSTLDGGYFGRRIGNAMTLGVFAGTTPDPTAWNFDPDRQIFGVFDNLEAGSFESWRYSSTVGVAQTRLESRPERYFLFSEQNLLVSRVLSIYHNAEVDYHRRGEFAAVESGIALTRSFLTFRAQPAAYLSFDLSHNFFQTVPTSDPRLIGTGLIDKVLFQGLSGGVRLRPIPLLTLYASLGRSDRQGDATPSWNYQYGATVDRIPGLGLRTDVRLSRFTSSFGSGAYQSASISRVVGEVFHLEAQVGRQNFHSALTVQNRTHWVNTTLDWFLGRHYVLGAGGTLYRGQAQNYDQWFFSLGYRL